MINNFLIINCIGKNDKLGLRINKDFFVYNLKNKKIDNENLVNKIFDFINNHNVIIDENFSVIVNQGPGSFSRSRISLSVAKGIKITKKVKLFGYRNNDLKVFDQQNIENLFHANLIEKKLIKPIYLS